MGCRGSQVLWMTEDIASQMEIYVRLPQVYQLELPHTLLSLVRGTLYFLNKYNNPHYMSVTHLPDWSLLEI